MVLTIPSSEAIAETQGSSIDALHLRYKNNDKDDIRLQDELKVRLMGPEALNRVKNYWKLLIRQAVTFIKCEQ